MQWFDSTYFHKKIEAAPLAVFRVIFGVMMFISILRFWMNGWIEKLYIEPSFFFSYLGFEWVKPLGQWTYVIFLVCAISSLMVAMGYRYRLSIIVFFLSFTYIELMDKTTYLNHYYFISLLSFLMIFLPAHVYYSVDAWKSPWITRQKVPQWTLDSVKLLVGIVYFFAGLAKLNSDWLLHAMPLRIWLPSSYDLPLIGSLLQKEWLHYVFSWSGAFFDLSIAFFLLYKRTRIWGYLAVVFFHVVTWLLFPIGMFPFIMIFTTLIFFDSKLHHKILEIGSKVFKVTKSRFDNGLSLQNDQVNHYPYKMAFLVVFFAIQVLLPFRNVLYPGELFWTEEGFRFSWRVMLMEKVGYTTYKVVDNESGESFYVDNSQYLTSFQEKQMSFQPDFILEYAHFLKEEYQKTGIEDVSVYADSYVALNGRRNARYIDPNVDLANTDLSLKHKNWILPFNDEIKGL